ncbi:hypothetical protein J3R30DRAFT_3483166 [Lentinula aciculospora]|uniref:Uncharacterized protein n=1 Tax=Lentinula aciculospora TaxID=153920 RepID=A0A9W9DM37_9AGAR|nr:hypothetical protein J3R30DRAFT_3483166 [Lentinula aciculospora]
MDHEKMPLLYTDDSSPNPKFPAAAFSFPESFAASQEQDRSRLRAQRRKRILRHLLVLFSFVFLGVYYFDLVHVHKYHSHRHHPHRSHWNNGVSRVDSDAGLHVPSGLTIQHCAEWLEAERIDPEGLYVVQHTFALPMDSDLLFLVARGRSMNGNVNIIQSNETSDSAVVTISTSYDDADLLNLFKLCNVAAREGENGVGIFSSQSHPRHHDHHVSFDITVAFPQGSGPSPLVVSDFKTEMKGIFGHQVANLTESIFFDSISLSGAYRPVHVDSLQARSVRIHSVNSPIEGNFTVKKLLRLSTANAHINISASLWNHKDDEDITELVMNTVNSPIEASVSLSEETTSSDGTFRVGAHNANGAVEIAFPAAPINSTVLLNAKTAAAPIHVQMHNTFEGAFTVHSAPFDKKIIVTDEGPDPEGKDRKRNLIFDVINRRFSKGKVFWGDEQSDRARGSVGLDTVSGQISLKF